MTAITGNTPFSLFKVASIYIKQSPFQMTGVLSKTAEWIELKLDPNFFQVIYSVVG